MNIQILSLDHVVFNVADVERSLQFYTETLGLKPERAEEFRVGAAPFPSVRVNSETIIDLFPPEYHRSKPRGNNVNHITLTVNTPPEQIKAYLGERGVKILREMTGNFGAQGNTAHAFQVSDPDGNTIELHAYVS